MPAHCCAYGCKNRQIPGADLKFFRIPRDPHLRAKWVWVFKRDDWEPTEHSRICSKHFINGHPSREPTNPDYVPSIFSYKAQPNDSLQSKVLRHQRLLERKENIAKLESAAALLSLGNELPTWVPGISTQTPVASSCEISIQTDITLPVMESLIFTNQYLKHVCDNQKATIDDLTFPQDELQTRCDQQLKELQNLRNSVQKLESDNRILTEEIDRKTLSYSAIKNDDKRTRFYTGFPNLSTLENVFAVASRKVKRRKTKLQQEDELLLTAANVSEVEKEFGYGRSRLSIQHQPVFCHKHFSLVVRCIVPKFRWTSCVTGN
ncbi:THAP domain-containing protein 6-like [Ostrea edulis]|uniref:THAP domain-containing protein 6-like n=1 Tax=Ostrea edulis TaxID=37623 RepID=UPI0024AF48B9|nr:THAP domain-containing protein 6-like [Ostrea edulis]